jgi:SAM-dependent methyltransferase
MEYKVHTVEWNDEKVKRFWDFYNNYAPFESLWFSKAVGRGVIRFVEKFFPIQGKTLDYGIGKGHFSGYLLENQNIQAYACDFSQDTVNNINAMFRDKPNFKGCSLVQGFPSGFSDNEFDIVFLIEAIEHLTDDYLLPTLAEAHRILKPGGKFVVTTPNNEVLEKQHVICPDCGGVFHRVQHVRSFNHHYLKELINGYGFKDRFCNATDFFEHGKKGLLYKTRNSVSKFLNREYQPPHLVYIGEKAS